MMKTGNKMTLKWKYYLKEPKYKEWEFYSIYLAPWFSVLKNPGASHRKQGNSSSNAVQHKTQVLPTYLSDLQQLGSTSRILSKTSISNEYAKTQLFSHENQAIIVHVILQLSLMIFSIAIKFEGILPRPKARRFRDSCFCIPTFFIISDQDFYCLNKLCHFL